MMTEQRMTMHPTTRLMMRIPLSSNFPLTLSISHDNPNHQSRAPPTRLKDEQEHTAAYLEQEFVLGVADEVHDKAHPQSGEERIDNVAYHGTYAGHKAVPTAFVQRALYAEHAYRSHWGRSEYTDKQAFDDKI